MLVQFDFLRRHPFLPVGGVVVVVAGKALIAAAGPALMAYSARVALLAGLAVAQIGEFSFVVAREGRAAGLLGEELYQGFLAVAVITMLVTPFLLQGGPALLDRGGTGLALARLLPGSPPEGAAPTPKQIPHHAII